MAWGQTTPLVLPSHSGLPSGVWGTLPFLCVQHNSPTPLLSFVWNRTCLLCAFVDAAAVAQPTGGTSGGAAAIATWTAATAVKAAAATFATAAAAAASAVAAGQRHRLAQRREPGPRQSLAARARCRWQWWTTQVTAGCCRCGAFIARWRVECAGCLQCPPTTLLLGSAKCHSGHKQGPWVSSDTQEGCKLVDAA